MKCRHCNADLTQTFLDLGTAPPSNAYRSVEDLKKPEMFYPLKVLVCTNCWLVQTEDFVVADEIFTADYAYFSSTSSSWLKHASAYAETIIRKLGLDAESLVIEVASNDGYLLKNFKAAGIPCLGIEPTESTASAAERSGIPVLRKFFGEGVALELAEQNRQADLVVGNNVYAHVPDINDFTQGLAVVLKPQGVVTLEFPHLLSLMRSVQFDTVYHEHFSYLSFTSVFSIFKEAGLKIVDVEKLSTHGGSLRVYGAREDSCRVSAPAVQEMLELERAEGLTSLSAYAGFQACADSVKNGLLEFLLSQKRAGKSVLAYGAAAKGNTLLNYAGVKADLLPCVCDAAPSKQGKYMPGSRMPILAPESIRDLKPDFVLVLPWNIVEEVKEQLSYIREWGGAFVTAVPSLRIQ